jgi:hypothetical protein
MAIVMELTISMELMGLTATMELMELTATTGLMELTATMGLMVSMGLMDEIKTIKSARLFLIEIFAHM